MSTAIASLRVLLGLDAAEFTTGLSKAEAQAEKFAEKQKRNQLAINRQIKALEQQAAVLGKSARETKLFELAQRGATDAQLKSADAALRQVERYEAMTAAASRFGAAAAVVGVAAAVGVVKLIDSQTKAIDAFNDLSDATGASVENISALDDIGRRTGTTYESVEGILVKFNAALKEAKPDSDAARILEALGLSAEELKRIDPAEALRLTAVALSGFAADGAQARAVQELFGKSVKEAAPFLKDLAEKGALVAKTTKEQAEEAERYQKNLMELTANAEDFARTLVNALVPSINKTIAKYKEARAEGLGWWAAIRRGQMEALGFDVGGTGEAAALTREIEELTDRQKKLRASMAPGAPSAWQSLYDPRLRKELDEVNARLGTAQERLSALADADKNYGNEGRNAPKPTLKVPDKPKKGGGSKAADDGTSELKRRLDGELALIRDFAESQRQGYEFANRYVEGAYAAGQIGLQEFFDTQQRIRDAGLAAQLESLDKQIAAAEKFARARPVDKDPRRASAERLEDENKIADLVARRAAIEQKAGQDAALIAQQQAQAVAHLAERYDDLRATILQLSGDTAGAARIRIEQQVEEARKIVTAQGGDPNLVGQYRQRLEGVEALSQAQTAYNRLLEQSRTAEEAVLLTAQETGAAELDTLRAVGDARARSLEQLGQMAVKARELADSLKTPEAIAFADQLALAFRKAAAEVDPLLTKIREFSRGVGDTVASGLANLPGQLIADRRALKQELAAIDIEKRALKSSQTSSDASQRLEAARKLGELERQAAEARERHGHTLRNLFASIGQDLANQVTQQLVTKPLGDMIANMLGGVGKDGGLLGRLFGYKAPAEAKTGGVDFQPINAGFAALQVQGIDPTIASLQRFQASLDAMRAPGAGTAIDTPFGDFDVGSTGASAETPFGTIDLGAIGLGTDQASPQLADLGKKSTAATEALGGFEIGLGKLNKLSLARLATGKTSPAAFAGSRALRGITAWLTKDDGNGGWGGGHGKIPGLAALGSFFSPSNGSQGAVSNPSAERDALRALEASTYGYEDSATAAQRQADEFAGLMQKTAMQSDASMGATSALAQLETSAAQAAFSLAFSGSSGGSGGGGGDILGSLLSAGLSMFTGGMGGGMSIDPGGIGITSGNAGIVDLGKGLLGGGRAIGGPVGPHSLHEVAENRPELLDWNGKKFLLMGSQGGHIDPNPSRDELGAAQVLHDGGVVGRSLKAGIKVPGLLKPNERRAVLELGEEVLTRNDPRHRDNNGKRLLKALAREPRYHSGGIVGRAPDRDADVSGRKFLQMASQRGNGEQGKRSASERSTVINAPINQYFERGTSLQTANQAGAAAARKVAQINRRFN